MMRQIPIHTTGRFRSGGTARRLGGWAGSAALLATALATGPAAVPAHAATGDLTCSVDFQFTFSPALKPGGTPNVSVTGTLSGCTSADGKYPNLKSGTAQATGTASSNASGPGPCGVLFTAQGTGTITWSPANTQSGLSFTVNTDPAKGTVTFKCNITSGALNGDSDVVAPAIKGADCTSDGMKTLSAHAVVNIG